MPDISDEQIAALVQSGDTEQYKHIITRYERKILRYGRKFLVYQEDISDLVQDIFIKAYINIKGFDTKRSFSPWLYRIAHNEFVNALRKKSREKLSFFDPFDTDTLFPHPVYEEPDVIDRDPALLKALETHLAKLDPKYREPLILYFFEEKNYDEISDIMRIPTSTVGIRLRRGKQKLLELLKPHISTQHD